jgi:hypothetical protein
MQFLYPYFLWALLALAIPVIIHLFYFRRFKKVYFTNVRFLKEIKEETSARNRLRNLLVLLSRILALLALILAFALPFLKNDNSSRIGRKASSVYIDNSFSMAAKAEDVTLLEKAKETARQIIFGYNEDDVYQILTNDFEGKHQRVVSKEEALELIEDIEISPVVNTLSNVENRQRFVLEKENVPYKNIYWVSDFQENIVDIKEISDSLYNYYLLPLQSVEESNLSIDSVWFESPVARMNESNSIFVKLTNRGNGPAENIRLSALHMGEEKPISVLDVDAGETVYDTFNLSISESGWQSIQVKITDHPVTFDDNYYLAFEVEERLNILVLSNEKVNAFLKSAFDGLDNMSPTIRSIRQVDFSKLSTFNMIVLDDVTSFSTGLIQELITYIKGGGNVLCFPARNADLEEYNNFLEKAGARSIKITEPSSRDVSSINTEEFIFKDVFARVNSNVRLPGTEYSYSFDSRSKVSEEVLLRYRDGGSYLSKYSIDQGRLYFCAAPINTAYNSLVQNAEIFVPMLYKMALSRSSQSRMSYSIGEDEVIELNQNEFDGQEVVEMHGHSVFIPAMNKLGARVMLEFHDQIKKDGVFSLKVADTEIQQLAFNYNRDESDLSCLPPDELRKIIGNHGQVITDQKSTDLAQFLKENEEGRPLWKWLLIFALVFLAIEQLLLKYWKV